MTADTRSNLWNSPGWFETSSGWIQDVLARHGRRLTGPVAQLHARPWSAVLRAPTGDGHVYFKAVAPVLGFEPAVTEALSLWRPDCLPQVLAIDSDRGWTLMADGGPTLREAFRGGQDINGWHDVLAMYAGLQIDLVERVGDLLVLGVRDRRLDLLPQLFADLLGDTNWLLIDKADGLTTGEHQRLVDAIPYVSDTCRMLAACKIPCSLHHNDLHDGNIFAASGRYLFFDWGDGSISHPFFSLRTVFVSIENTFGLAENDPLFDDFAGSYLRPWLRYETEDNLWRAYELAQKMWAISSAVKYWTILRGLDLDSQAYGRAIPSLLKEFLETSTGQ